MKSDFVLQPKSATKDCRTSEQAQGVQIARKASSLETTGNFDDAYGMHDVVRATPFRNRPKDF